MLYHLAQVNIARLRQPPTDPAMADFVARIDAMNRLADRSPGFVWRLPGPEATPEALGALADYVVPFDAARLFYNLSVWRSVEDLRQYVFQTAHAEMLRQRQRWIEHFDRAYLAMWWIAAGETPTIAESVRRLRRLDERGAIAEAFTFQNCFPRPA